MSYLDRILDNYTDPYADLYLYLRSRIINEGMKFHFNVDADLNGVYVLKNKQKIYLKNFKNLLDLCVDFVSRNKNSWEYFDVCINDKSEKSMYSRNNCFKPVIFSEYSVTTADLVKIEIRSKETVLYKPAPPKFQIAAFDLISDLNSCSFDLANDLLLQNKEIEIFIKADPLTSSLESNDLLTDSKAFHTMMLNKYLKTTNSLFEQQVLIDRLLFFGLENKQDLILRQFMDSPNSSSSFEAVKMKDCLKMDLLCKNILFIENNDKLLELVYGEYQLIVDKISKHKLYYEQNQIVRNFEWDF